jgi:hypothetical protein
MPVARPARLGHISLHNSAGVRSIDFDVYARVPFFAVPSAVSRSLAVRLRRHVPRHLCVRGARGAVFTKPERNERFCQLGWLGGRAWRRQPQRRCGW